VCPSVQAWARTLPPPPGAVPDDVLCNQIADLPGVVDTTIDLQTWDTGAVLPRSAGRRARCGGMVRAGPEQLLQRERFGDPMAGDGMIRRVAASLVAVVGLLPVCGCSQQAPEEGVPDATLFTTISSLTGVASTDLSFSDELGNSRTYSGTVTVSPGADARCVLYQVSGVLEQGHRGSDSASVTVVQGDRSLSPGDLPPEVWPELQSLEPRAPDTPTIPDCAEADLATTSLASPTP
jgi:hypothetical protein